MNPSTILNLGCGRKRMTGAVNLDVTPDTAPDVVWNLDQHPWPFKDGSFETVYALDVVEHLTDVLAAMQEIHRISRNGARIHITVPHFSCVNTFRDPTHKHAFSWFSFHYVTGENQWDFYTSARFRRVSTRMVFHPTLLNKLVWRLAQRWPEEYERRWAWMFPAWYLAFELEVVKE